MGIDWEATPKVRLAKEAVSYFKGPWGLNNEVLHMLGYDNGRGMDLWRATQFSLGNWLLRCEDGNTSRQDFAHESAHLLLALTVAALKDHPYIVRNYPDITRLLTDATTQGDMHVEAAYVVPVQVAYLKDLFDPFDGGPEKVDLSSKEPLKGQVDKILSVAKNPKQNILGLYNEDTIEEYNQLATKVFNIARMRGESLFDIRIRHNFDSDFVITNFACTRRKNGHTGNDNDLCEPVEPGESFHVDGELQIFEPLRDPKDNPNIEIVFAAMVPGLQLIQREMIALKSRTPAKKRITNQMKGEAVNARDFFIEVRRNLNWALGLVPKRPPVPKAA